MSSQSNSILSDPRPQSIYDFLTIAVWFGLATGLFELLSLTARKFLWDDYLHVSHDVVWMAPAGNTLYFLGLAFLLIMLSHFWPQLRSFGTSSLLFSFLLFISILLMAPGLHPAAMLLLAGGLAFQWSKYLTRFSNRILKAMRQSALVFLGTIILTSLGIHGWMGFSEQQALGSLASPHSPQTPMPNILLIVWDTVRAKSLSLYGHPRPTTPHLDMLGSSGVTFENAISTSSWTLPSHASMFTGKFPHTLSANWKSPLDSTDPTLAEILQSQGYITAGFVANTYYVGRESGLSRGFIHYDEHPIGLEQIVLSTTLGQKLGDSHWLRKILGGYQRLGRKNVESVNDSFLNWLGKGKKAPYFAFLNYLDAHHPYLPPEPFNQRFGPPQSREDPWTLLDWEWTSQEMAAERQAYEASIAYIDHHFGQLITQLTRQGQMENTLIIVTSDHGELFDEHGLFGHAVGLYYPLIHVPLVISFPNHIESNSRIIQVVSLKDLPATILDLIGLQEPFSLPGNPLTPFLKTEKKHGEYPTLVMSDIRKAINHPDWLPVMKGDMQSLVFNEYHFIKNGDGTEEMYDLVNDPDEITDISDQVVAKNLLSCFQLSLDHTLVSGQSPEKTFFYETGSVNREAKGNKKHHLSEFRHCTTLLAKEAPEIKTAKTALASSASQ